MTTIRDSDAEFDQADREARQNGTDHGLPSEVTDAVAQALAESRVDLLALIDKGIPAREFVPGSARAIARRKRHYVAAPAKSGKSIVLGVVLAVDAVLAGEIVTVLDRENGADEYARRLEPVLSARDVSDEQRELVRANYRYYAWPQVKLEWGSDPIAYAKGFGDSTLAIFDSTRKFLTSLGLKENDSDDYDAFTEALIDPLAVAGITTIALDNTGHVEKKRGRGTSSKGDLADVAFALKAADAFSLTRRGRVEMEVTLSRIGELSIGERFVLEIGSGHYGSWQRAGEAEQRRLFHAACVAALEAKPLGREKLLAAVRASGFSVDDKDAREWLPAFAGDEQSPIRHDDAHGYFLPTGGVGG